MKKIIIKECRDYLAGKTTLPYDYLRGKLIGFLYGDIITPGEYMLWYELIFFKHWGTHSDSFLIDMFK